MTPMTPEEVWTSQETFHKHRLTYRAGLPRVADLLGVAEKRYGIPREQICGKRRLQNIVRARHFVMYEARIAGRSSLAEIGRRLGGRDHSTVIHGANRHAERYGLPKPWEAA